MTATPPPRGPVGPTASLSVLRMAAPLVVSFVMRAAFTLVDTAYAATLGDAAVAAVGLAIPFEFAMIAVWVGLSTGLTSCLARAMGSHNGRRVDQYLRTARRLVLATTPLFVAIGAAIWLVAPRVGLDAEVGRSFAIYGGVLVAGSALTMFWSVIPDSVVKAHHDTRATMWAGIWSNVINLVLNTLFTFGFGWGVFGIALSTVLGRIGGLVYALARASEHERRRRAAGEDRARDEDPTPYRSILALAVPSSLTILLTATESAVTNGLLAPLPGATEAIAAYSIYYRVTLFALNPVLATGVAMLPYAARRFAERDAPGLRRGLRESLAASAAYSLAVVGPLLFFGAPWLAGVLAESPATREQATFALRLAPLACLASAPIFLCRPLFEGMGRGRPGLAMATIRYGMLTAPAAWLGMQAAAAVGRSPLSGAVVGLLVAAAVSSLAFVAWTVRSLRAVEGPQPDLA